MRPHLLYQPDASQTSRSSVPDASADYQLLDRVVNVRHGFGVPLGLRGTVVGVRNATSLLDVVYEVLFDEPFAGAVAVRGAPDAPKRVQNAPAWALINVSHGLRQQRERQRQGKPTAVVRPTAGRPGPNAAAGAAAREAPAAARPEVSWTPLDQWPGLLVDRKPSPNTERLLSLWAPSRAGREAGAIGPLWNSSSQRRLPPPPRRVCRSSSAAKRPFLLLLLSRSSRAKLPAVSSRSSSNSNNSSSSSSSNSNSSSRGC